VGDHAIKDNATPPHEFTEISTSQLKRYRHADMPA
jgi:hypothetical protein